MCITQLQLQSLLCAKEDVAQKKSKLYLSYLTLTRHSTARTILACGDGAQHPGPRLLAALYQEAHYTADFLQLSTERRTTRLTCLTSLVPTRRRRGLGSSPGLTRKRST